MVLNISRFRDYFKYEISLLIGSTANVAGDGPQIRANSLHLNGFKICRMEFRYYISEIKEDILNERFRNNHIQVGDEVIKVNDEFVSI